jgi:excisionase family DNA binding protein
MEVLTVLEVSVRMHVTPLTVRRWLKAGSLRGLHCEDRAGCRIREHDLTTFREARRRSGVQDRSRPHS